MGGCVAGSGAGTLRRAASLIWFLIGRRSLYSGRGDGVGIDGFESGFIDGDAIHIPCEIQQDTGGIGLRGSGMDDPCFGQWLGGQVSVESLECGKALGAVDRRECPHGQDVTFWRGLPLVLLRHATGGDDEVDVGMEVQVLSPCVEHGDDAWLDAGALPVSVWLAV